MNFNELIKNNRQNVQNIIKLVTKENNEDLEQEVFVKVWRNSHKYTEQGSFKSWINVVAKNVAKDYLKSSKKKIQDNSTSDDFIVNSIEDKKTTPELRLIKNDRKEKITKAINNLKPKFREVIILAEIEGRSYEECAKKIKCPVGTVKSRLYNAKKELATTLKDLM